MPLLSIENLGYSPTAAALPDRGGFLLSVPQLKIEVGERVALVGSSGSGKTTLLNLIAGILPADTGSINFAGQELTSLQPSQMDQVRSTQMGLLFQSFHLLPFAHAIDNVEAAGVFAPDKRSRVRSGEAKTSAQLLIALGLSDTSLQQRPVRQLSIGQQQRVAAARALYGNPSLVLADEPTSALDTASRDQFLDLLFKSLDRNNQSLVMVTHDTSMVSVFDRVIDLEDIAAEAA